MPGEDYNATENYIFHFQLAFMLDAIDLKKTNEGKNETFYKLHG